MKKLIEFLTDPYVIVPTLLGGVVGYYAKGKSADGAGRYVWPAGGIAAGLTAGYLLHARQTAAAELVEAANKLAAQSAAAAKKAVEDAKAEIAKTETQQSSVGQLPSHVTLDDEYDTEIDFDGDSDIDVDDMFTDDDSMSLDEYEPVGAAPSEGYRGAAPSEGYRGPAPAPMANATPTEEHAYRMADEIAQEMGHGSLGDGNGASDYDLAGGWGGYTEATLDGDVAFEDLAEGVPGMLRGRNGHSGN